MQDQRREEDTDYAEIVSTKEVEEPHTGHYLFMALSCMIARM